jgi:hypothetical protein
MTPADRDTALENLCQEVLGDWTLLTQHPTQRPGSHVWRVRNTDGQEFVAKRHLNQQKHQREDHAYTQWVPALSERAPRLIASEPRVPAIVMTAIPGEPADGGVTGSPPHPGSEADYHRQAGELLRRLHTTRAGPLTSEPPNPLSRRLEHWLPAAQLILTTDDIALVASCTACLADAKGVPLVPCHLDYQPRNWVIDRTGVLRIVDFEHARLDVAIRDIVRLEYRHWLGRPDLREAFYEGYATPLHDRDRALLKACAALDAVTAIVRGQAGNDPLLTAHGYTTLRQLRDGAETENHRKPLRPRDGASPRSTIMATQLDDPDHVGRDLTLFRTRAYRFSDDPRHYVMAETAEEHFLSGKSLSPAVLTQIRYSLDQLRTNGRIPAFDPDSAAADGLDLELELARRGPHLYSTSLAAREPDLVVAIVGAPRSGTSHLVNVLARQHHFAYFTTASCWAWPVWNLHHSERHLFTEFGDVPLSVDNKRTRIIPSLVMPAEAEDVYARAIPVYRHMSGHRYAMDFSQQGDLGILRAGTQAHIKYFNSTSFLTKSPFHSFRIPAFERLWGTRMRYVHIARDRDDSALSMARNNFEYIVNDRVLSPAEAWFLFENSLAGALPTSRVLKVTYGQLLADESGLVRNILDWLKIDQATA